jgi:uncharacterized protein
VFFYVRDLEVKAGRFDVDLPPGAIAFLDPKLRQKGHLKASGKVELVSGSLGEIRVKGHVAALIEAEMGFYEGDGIELNDVLREYVLLALPMQRLCSENCNGICPVCGQNRNQRQCQCRTAAVDDRWAALKQLK